MNFDKKWKLVIPAGEAGKTMEFSLKSKTSIIVMSLLGLFMISIVASLIYIGNFKSELDQLKIIQSENAILRQKITAINSNVDSLIEKIHTMEKWEDSIRADENFKKVNKEVRSMGTGGMTYRDSLFDSYDKNLGDNYNSVLKKLSLLTARTDFAYSTHEDLLKKVELREDIYRYTPSIYPTFGRISDPYGWRRHPITGKRSFHHGLDFSNKKGTPIYATADGVVTKTSYGRNIGRMIIIEHKYGYKTKYGHLHKYLVKKGDKVKKGQIIALMGSTGRSTGSHVHYEVSYYNRTRNPYRYLNKLEKDIKLTRR